VNGVVGVSKITDEAERICASKIALIGVVERLVLPLHGVATLVADQIEERRR
jgi:hypothetical protein